MSVAELAALARQPGLSDDVRHSHLLRLGDALTDAGNLERAAKAFAQAVRLVPSSAGAYYSLGVALGKARRAAQAHSAFAHATTLAPTHALSHRALALAASMLGHTGDAAKSLRHALRLDPGLEEARFDLGVALQQLGQPSEALVQYDRLLSRSPAHPSAHANRGTVLKDLARPVEAAEAYSRALQTNPRFPEVYNNLAVLCAGDLRQPERALRLVEAGRALVVPGGAGANLDWESARGLALTQLRRLGEASSAYAAAYRAFPGVADSACQLFLSRMRLADWTSADQLQRDVRRLLLAGECERTWDPLYGLAAPHVPPQLLLELSRRVAQRKQDLATAARMQLRGPWPGWAADASSSSSSAKRHRRLRVGFLSADFRWHVMGFLTLGLLEESARFGHLDVHALSLSPDDGSAWPSRFRKAVTHPCESRSRQGGGGDCSSRFVDLSRKPDSASASSLARAIASRQLHLLIDLNGYTTDERSEVLAFKPAPVAMQAVGYPGSMGAGFVPYMLSDRYAVSPPAARAGFSERLVIQPHSYQANDHARYQLGRGPEMADGGPVSEHRPLLVNFNQLYKISPTAGALWCAVMLRVTPSRLWLLQQPVEGEPHVRGELAGCGIHQLRRVSFAPLVPDIGRHLSRTRAASLLIDTPEYNCHTTGTDALWSGVPMLTVSGDTMAARVGGSLVRASGLLGGQVHSAKEYADVGAWLVRRDLQRLRLS